jgi:hypothetical protein
MNLFFICPEINCNRKYKTKNKLIDHLLYIHKIIADEIGEAVEITKENKKNVEIMKDNIKRIKHRELLIKEAEEKKQLELIAKLEAEDLYKQQLEEKYKLVEEQKIKQQEKLINDKFNFNKSIEEQCIKMKHSFNEINGPLINILKEEYSLNPTVLNEIINVLSKPKDKHNFIEQAEKKPICSICLDADANAAIVPCGHSNFCHECISSYHIDNQNKVCPICRDEIMMVMKLYV